MRTSFLIPSIRAPQHAFYTSGDLVDELYLNMDPCLKMRGADMTLTLLPSGKTNITMENSHS